LKIILGIFVAVVLLTSVFTNNAFASTDTCREAIEARKQIESLDRKYSELKKKVYSDWESQTKSGQYSGTWDEYAQKLLDSSEVKEIQTLRQKYAEIDQKCVQYGPTKPEYSDAKKQSCDTTDYKNIKKTFFAIEQKVIAAKEKHYKNWESLVKSGSYSGTWDQYAAENLNPSQEMMEYQKIQAKYDTMIQFCQSEPQSEPKTLPIPAGCNMLEFESAKKILAESSNKVSTLKENLYLEWKALSDVGKTSEPWDVYFSQRFETASEVKEWRALQDKFSVMMHICTPTNTNIVQPTQQSLELKSASDKKTEKSSSKYNKESEKQDKITKAKKIKKSKKTSAILAKGSIQE
jgi:hypothetical protein